MKDDATIEAYLRVLVGSIEDADGLIDDMGDEFFAPAEYLGSATLDYDDDVPEELRFHMLIGLRGTEDQLWGSIDHIRDFVGERTGVEATIQKLEVDELLVSRTLTAGVVPLFDPGYERPVSSA